MPTLQMSNHDSSDAGPQQSATDTAVASASREYLPDREARNPYLRWLTHLGLPMSVSLLLHAMLVSALVLTSWSTRSAARESEYEAGIASAVDLGGGLKWPGAQPIVPDAPADEPTEPDATKFSDDQALRDLLRSEDAKDRAAGDGGGFGFGESGSTSVLGLGSGAGTPGTGGLGSGSGIGAGLGRAAVWNVSAPGEKFAYVLDFSGSITVVEDDLKREIKRSIGALAPTQSFGVLIFYSEYDAGARTENFKTDAFQVQLVLADPDNRRKLFSWIDRRKPRGATQPLQALKRALALKPDAIFFFSDGDFDDKLVDEIGRANEGRKTAIHCLVFDEALIQDTGDMPQLTSGARRLEKIAQQNGGKMKVVTVADFKP
ncbi:MAG: hypothetical protein ACKVS9_10300 [Phycisphaerae bacterium]